VFFHFNVSLWFCKNIWHVIDQCNYILKHFISPWDARRCMLHYS
jgi:hypothetical protein